MKCIQAAVLQSILLAVSVFAEITPGVEVGGNSSAEGEFQKTKPHVQRQLQIPLATIRTDP
jgi:hypothetical protein